MLKKATQNQNQKKEKKRHTVRVTTVRFRFPTSNHPSPSASSCDATDSDSVLALVAVALLVPVTDPSFAFFPGAEFVEPVFARVDGEGAETAANHQKFFFQRVEIKPKKLFGVFLVAALYNGNCHEMG
jgi:hypothetical protein